MKTTVCFAVIIMALSGLLYSQEKPDISAEQAFEMLKNPSTYLIDVRTIAEYYYVGHPDMAYNIPLMFWDEQKQGLLVNRRFIEDVKSRFKPEDTLLVICRSGGRSARARRMLTAAGFTLVYNLQLGFEGESDGNGYRTVNGWKNSGLPYTYRIDPKLTYRFP